MTDTAHGPKYLALSPLRQRWVQEFVINGGKPTEAAYVAGYGESSPDEAHRKLAARVAGYQNSHDEDVLAALNEEAGLKLRSGAMIGASVLIEIAQDALHKDRFKAAKELLGHNGFNIITEHKVTVEHTPDQKEVVRQITGLAEKMGIDPRKLLGEYGVVVDAEFSVVADGHALPAPISTAAGLEDLLSEDDHADET